jgi:hypothetical protein
MTKVSQIGALDNVAKVTILSVLVSKIGFKFLL